MAGPQCRRHARRDCRRRIRDRRELGGDEGHPAELIRSGLAARVIRKLDNRGYRWLVTTMIRVEQATSPWPPGPGSDGDPGPGGRRWQACTPAQGLGITPHVSHRPPPRSAATGHTIFRLLHLPKIRLGTRRPRMLVSSAGRRVWARERQWSTFCLHVTSDRDGLSHA